MQKTSDLLLRAENGPKNGPRALPLVWRPFQAAGYLNNSSSDLILKRDFFPLSKYNACSPEGSCSGRKTLPCCAQGRAALSISNPNGNQGHCLTALPVRERKQIQNKIKIAESLWKCIFAVLIGERGTSATTEALPVKSDSAGSPSCVQCTPTLKPVPQIKGLNSPSPEVSHDQSTVGPIPFFSSNSSFTFWYLHPFLDTLSRSTHPSFNEKQPVCKPSAAVLPFTQTQEAAPYTGMRQNIIWRQMGKTYLRRKLCLWKDPLL